MNLTTFIQKQSKNFEVHNEGEWGGTVSEYSAFNDGGVECEIGEFLYGCIRMVKPDRALETGTHLGVGSSYMGMALRENNKGKLDTIEFLPELHKKAKDNLQHLGLLGSWVECHLADATTWKPTQRFQFILLDTEPQTRFAEAIRYIDGWLDDGGLVFIHDLHRHMQQVDNPEHGFAWPFGKIPKELNNMVKEDVLRPFHFGTPRGLTGFYKVHPNDYKW